MFSGCIDCDGQETDSNRDKNTANSPLAAIPLPLVESGRPDWVKRVPF